MCIRDSCNRFEALSEARCGRCNTALRARKPQSVQRTLALTVTATLLMVPAHVYPIMKVQTLGNVQESTIVDGVIALWQHGSYPHRGAYFYGQCGCSYRQAAGALLACSEPQGNDTGGS